MKKKAVLILAIITIVLLIVIISLYTYYMDSGNLIWIPGLLMIIGLLFNWFLIRKLLNRANR